MNSVSVNLHNCCNKLVNLHNYILTNIGQFQAKLYKFYTFFYYTWTNVLLKKRETYQNGYIKQIE